MRMTIRKFDFTDNLEYQFLKEAQLKEKVLCTIYKLLFAVEHGSPSDVLQGEGGTLVAVRSKSCNQKVTSYFSCKQYQRSATNSSRIVLLYRIKHNHSFRSSGYNLCNKKCSNRNVLMVERNVNQSL
jgi:hypothetical protein